MSVVPDSTYLLAHTIVGWMLTVGSALLLLPAVQFLAGKKSPLAVDAVGHYFVAFAGVLNLVWGLSLVATSGDAATARLLAGPSAAGFALMALFRVPFSKNEVILAELGKAPRYEVILFAGVAAFFGASALG